MIESLNTLLGNIDLISDSDILFGSVVASFLLVLVLSINLIRSRAKNKALLKAHAHLIQKQQIELKIINDKLRANEDKLKVQDMAKEKFISLISNDIKKPLMALKSYAYTLKMKGGNISPWELTSYTVSLEKSLSHLIGLLNNVSRWNMVHTPVKPNQFDNININKMISYTLKLMKSSADKKRVALLKNINCQVEVMADANMIEFILRNLVGNAIKFSKEGDAVMVKLRNDENNFSISVKDNGIGMDEFTIATLFKVKDKTSANDTGSVSEGGIGLILCKELLEKLGGSIEVVSKPNQGALFTISLPKNVLQYNRMNDRMIE